MKKAQSAVEFVILLGVVLFIFLMFVGVIQFNISDEVAQNRDSVAKEIALTVQNELVLAESASEGYYREFVLPPSVLGIDYEIFLTGDHVFLKTDNEKHAVAVSSPNVTGNLNPGTNTIEVIEGEVVING